ncbi:hypothetical protein JCM3775_001545 [Rhodotorula graminis]
MLQSAALVVAAAALAAAQAPSYAPIRVDCPSAALIGRLGDPTRGNQTLPPDEQQYIDNRRNNVLPDLWQQYLNDNATGSTGYSASEIVGGQPNLGIAISGGGLRASLYGAGTLSALDGRNSSTAGPLLQLASYLAGLSGGSWTVTSVALNDLEPIYSLVTGANSSRTGGWQLDRDILAPSGLLGFSDNGNYYDSLEEDVRAKAAAGFPISITDLWGRALAYHFLNGTTEDNFFSTDAAHDQGTLFSSIRYTTSFQSGQMPYPILATTSRINENQQLTNDSTSVIPLENTGFEISPFTFGSFEATLAAYIPLEYLGTQLSNGQPTNRCVNYFDNAGFAMGSSASLFNAVQEGFVGATFSSLLSNLLQAVTDLDPPEGSVALVANYPNSFGNFTPDTGYSFESAGEQILQVTDGGEDGQNVPLMPLLAKARALDAIFAVDGSADTSETYANGTSLVATAQKVELHAHNYTRFPDIPHNQQEFVDQGLTTRPTFFGCNISDANMGNYSNYPIIIYHPNSAGANPGATNYSTFKLSYEDSETISFLDAANLYAKRGYPDPSTPTQPDEQWPLCLKCAVVDRARQRAGVARTDACQACLNRYCWSPEIADQLVNATQTAGNNTPASGGGGGGGASPSSGAARALALPAGGVVAAAAAVLGGLALLA